MRWIFILAVLILISGCSHTNPDLIGCWQSKDGNYKITFENKDFSILSNDTTVEGTYKITEMQGKLTLILNNERISPERKNEEGSLFRYVQPGEKTALIIESLTAGKELKFENEDAYTPCK